MVSLNSHLRLLHNIAMILIDIIYLSGSMFDTTFNQNNVNVSN